MVNKLLTKFHHYPIPEWFHSQLETETCSTAAVITDFLLVVQSTIVSHGNIEGTSRDLFLPLQLSTEVIWI